MKEKLQKDLKEKGWSEEEIEKTIRFLENHGYLNKEINRVLYWSGLLVLTVANILISVVLIPFLILFTQSIYLYLMIMPIAFFFGFIVNILISDIESLERRHHIFAIIFIPAIAIITFIVSVLIAKGVAGILNLTLDHNPFIVGVLYSAIFILPYLIANREKIFKG